jgi:hypothetical protein
MTCNANAKLVTRTGLAALVAAFKGTITVCPPGKRTRRAKR